METSRTGRVKTKYNDFSGGVQVYTSPLWVQDNESPFCKNIDLSRPGVLRKALGYSELGSASGGDSPKGAFVYDSENGSSVIYKLSGDTLSKFEGSWSSVGTVSGADSMQGALMYIDPGSGSFVERMYFTTGLGGTLKYTDGTSISEVADIYAKHIAVYKSRIYLGDVKQGTESFPSRVIYSGVSTHDFDGSSFIDDFGEPITALKEYSGSLFFFSENKLAAYDEYKLQTIPGNFGTTSSHSVQTVQSNLVWYNRSGVYMYAGGMAPQNISKRVQSWIEAIVDPHSVTAGVDSQERYNLYIGDVTVEGVNYKDVVLRYDLSLNAWDILPDRPFKYWLRQRAGGVYKAYATDVSEDKVWQVNEGTSLNGVPIESEWVSAKLDMGQPDTYKNFYKAYIVFRPTGVDEHLSLEYRLDGTKAWSKIEGTQENVPLEGSDDVKVVRLQFPGGVQAKMIQFRLKHTSDVSGFNLYEININGDELRQ